jgi:excisionase family DNA binding protein
VVNVRRVEPASSWLTTREVAERWGVHPGTVRKWVSRGVIPGTTEPLPYQKVGTAVRFTPQQVEYIESRMERTNPRLRRRARTSRGAA